MLNKRRLLILEYIFIICLLFCSTDSSAAEIAVIKSRDIEPYNIIISGIKKVIKGNVSVNNMDGDVKRGIDIIERLKLDKPDIILTLGSEASAIAGRNVKTIPVVFSMVINPQQYNVGSGNITGIGIDIPVKTQLRFYKEILPGTKRIGIIYADDATKKFINEAELIADEINVKIMSVKIKDIKELPQAVENVLSEADSLWLLFDPVVTSSRTAVKDILIFNALLKKVPVIGFNKWCVTVGSLYCLYSEYEDIGRQTGEMVNRILNGESPASIPAETPRDIKILFNDKVLDRVSSRYKINMPANAYVWGGE